jgi:hypothetical protein
MDMISEHERKITWSGIEMLNTNAQLFSTDTAAKSET